MVVVAIDVPVDDREIASLAAASLRSNAVEFPTRGGGGENDDDAHDAALASATRALLRVARYASVHAGEFRGRTSADVRASVVEDEAASARRGEAAAPTRELAAHGLALRALADAMVAHREDVKAVESLREARERLKRSVSERFGEGGRAGGGAATSEDATCEDMFRWTRDRGGWFKFVPRVVDSGAHVMREVRASEVVEAGDVAAYVPWRALLGVEQVVQSPASSSPTSEILRQLTAIGDQAIMAIWLTAALDALDSGNYGAFEEWAPALRALPRQLSSALAWSETDLATIAGEDQARRLSDFRKSVRVQYDALFPALCEQLPDAFPLSAFGDYAKFQAAYDIWTAYAMKVQDPDTLEIREVIVPGVFLCNHSLTAHSMRYTSLERGTKSFRLELVRGIAPGEPVTISYGRLDNADLMMFYGFSLENNPYDRVSLGDVTGDVSETQLEALRCASQMCDLDLTRLPVCVARDGSLDRVMAQMRIIHSPEKFYTWCEAEDYHPFVVVDTALECDILQYLLARLRAMRDKIYTTSGNGDAVASATYWYRHGQMQIMESAITRMEALLHEYSRRKRARE